MKEAKLKLDMELATDGFFEDTRLLGIVAPVKSHQFCWQLNHMLQFNFRLYYDIQLKKKNRDYFFPVYEYPEPNSFLVHYLYNNSFDGEYLLPEFKHMDFLWLIKGDAMEDETVHLIVKTIKQLNHVQMIGEITNEKIRNKEHLIL